MNEIQLKAYLEEKPEVVRILKEETIEELEDITWKQWNVFVNPSSNVAQKINVPYYVDNSSETEVAYFKDSEPYPSN